MSTPSPSWYDLLGVEPDASAEEIRTAWRAAIADLDPTDRRFATFSRAGEVLLDPERRAAYDAELAETETETDPEPPREPELEPEPDREPEPVATAPAPATVGRERRVVPGWLLVGMAVLTLVVAGIAGAVAATVPSDRSVEADTSAARAAAERAVVPVLSYDATKLDASRAAAEKYLTGDYRKDYDQLFDGIIKQNAPSTGTVVTASVVRSGVARVDGDRVQVFVLLDQSRTNKASATPVVYRNWVTVTMQEEDGDWLVSAMDT